MNLVDEQADGEDLAAARGRWRDGQGLRSVAVDDALRAESGHDAVAWAPRAQVPLPPEQPGSRVVLSGAQLAVPAATATSARRPRRMLFADGDETYDLIVVLEGGVAIVEHHGQPDEVGIVTYGPREFIGRSACSPASAST